MSNTSAQEALDRLVKGNRLFASDSSENNVQLTQSRRAELVAGQKPFAIILGCADSRVPAEIVFGQGLGDLFVVRVAGNIAAPSQIGSIEFAVAKFGSPLIVVLGHSSCGAISATLDQITAPSEGCSPSLLSIVDRIRPTVEASIEQEGNDDREGLIKCATRANVCASVEQLRRDSQLLGELASEGELMIVGAEYSLETGVVEFFDEASG